MNNILIKPILCFFLVLFSLSATNTKAKTLELSHEQKAELIETMQNLSAGDLSSIAMILKTPNSQQGTSKGSANYSFLLKLEEYGFAEQLPIDANLPAALADKLTAFQIKENAKPKITSLLKEGRPEYADALQRTLTE